MNRYESFVACVIIAFFTIALVIRFVFEILKLFLSRIGEFFSLVSPWVWGTAFVIAIVIGLIGFALWVVHRNTRLRNKASVVPVDAQHAVIFQDGITTAISFNGRRITSKQIGRCPLPQPEQSILTATAKRQRKVEYAAPKFLKGKGGAA